MHVPAVLKKVSKERWYQVACALLVALVLILILTPRDGRHMRVTAEGDAEWLYQTSPDGPEALKVKNFEAHAHAGHGNLHGSFLGPVYAGGNRQTVPVEERDITVERVENITGSIQIEVTDLSPVDANDSRDKASMYASFISPRGEHIEVKFVSLVPPTFPSQGFGGVAINHFINGDTNLGSDKLHTEYAYQILYSITDVYRDGTLIADNVFTYIATSQRAEDALNPGKVAGRYDPEKPLAKMMVHLVIFPYGYTEDGTFEFRPTGLIGPHGVAQEFIHVNFLENIKISGNRFFH